MRKRSIKLLGLNLLYFLNAVTGFNACLAVLVFVLPVQGGGDRVKIPSGGGLAFELPGEDDENPESATEIVGVILDHHPSLSWLRLPLLFPGSTSRRR